MTASQSTPKRGQESNGRKANTVSAVDAELSVGEFEFTSEERASVTIVEEAGEAIITIDTPDGTAEARMSAAVFGDFVRDSAFQLDLFRAGGR